MQGLARKEFKKLKLRRQVSCRQSGRETPRDWQYTKTESHNIDPKQTKPQKPRTPHATDRNKNSHAQHKWHNS